MKKLRVMWLLNHTTARSFEIPMLKALGVKEIFLPKIVPKEASFRSYSIDYSEDQFLLIDKKDLEILNNTDWYAVPNAHSWEIANKYFDIAFFIMHNVEFFDSITLHFKGAILWRQYGLDKSLSYSKLLEHKYYTTYVPNNIETLKGRFWCAQAYKNLSDNENSLIQQTSIYLPLGIYDIDIKNDWLGIKEKVLFICPDIGFNSYYQNIYIEFKKNFRCFPYVVGGQQSKLVDDSSVLGFLSAEEYRSIMQELRVMFYHSTEPYHVHYHPFEAVLQGMPLIFMAGGMLDQLGGIKLPGRCQTIREAKKKIQKILNDDWEFIESIRKSQVVLLEAMQFNNCLKDWQQGFDTILNNLISAKERMSVISSYKPNNKKKKIAVILPVAYKGGSLRGAKLFAEALYLGSIKSGEEAEIILAHLDLSEYSEEDFLDMHPAIKRRVYNWRLLNRHTAIVAFNYAGRQALLDNSIYQIPDDGINYLLDCDLWVFISDRLEYPLLPIKPYVIMVYDYLQHYEQFLTEDSNQAFIRAAKKAVKVIVTTEFTKQEALGFAGILQFKVVKCPMLIPNFIDKIKKNDQQAYYFLWTTNLAIHKNHVNAFKALSIYYNELNGQLNCYMTGVNTDLLFKEELLHLKGLHKLLDINPIFKNKFKNLGYLPEMIYQETLGSSQFLWHPARIDNGTFSVVEAAFFDIPSLSSNYPAMQEINHNFKLNMMMMDPWNPLDMAQKLKQMEIHAQERRELLPSKEELKNYTAQEQAVEYWRVVREYL